MRALVTVLVSSLLIACGGGGGGSSGSVSTTTKLTPISVQKSSYLNSKNINSEYSLLPEYSHATAFGDFFQSGELSIVSSSVLANPQNPADQNKTSVIKFFKKINGVWVDKTSNILQDQTGCVWPRKAIVADFNNDNKPDVFFACTGFDAHPFAGEVQRVLLSQPSGVYKNTIVNYVLYAHGGAAADFNNNGYSDVVLTNTAGTGQPIYLVNMRDGTFSVDTTKIALASATAYRIYSAEIIDTNNDGEYDLLLGGTDTINGLTQTAGSNAWSASVSINDGEEQFGQQHIVIQNNATYPITLDFVKVDNILYVYRVTENYTGVAVQKVDLTTGVQSIIYAHTGPYANGQSWFNWIIYSNGRLYPNDPSFNISISI